MLIDKIQSLIALNDCAIVIYFHLAYFSDMQNYSVFFPLPFDVNSIQNRNKIERTNK